MKFQNLHGNYFTINDFVFESYQKYDWPGNLIEIENEIERLCATFENKELNLEDLPQKFKSQQISEKKLEINIDEEGLDLNVYLKEIETEVIKKALERTNGNKNKASKLLKLNRTTLIEKMKKRKINRSYPRFEN